MIYIEIKIHMVKSLINDIRDYVIIMEELNSNDAIQVKFKLIKTNTVIKKTDFILILKINKINFQYLSSFKET